MNPTSFDADTWVQQRFALDYLKTYSADGKLVCVQRSRFHEWDATRGNGVEFNFSGQPVRANWYTMFSRNQAAKARSSCLTAHTECRGVRPSGRRCLVDDWQAAVMRR